MSPYFEFKCNSALTKEGNSNKFACWPNEGVQRELGLANLGPLGTANSSGVSATTYKSTSSGFSPSPVADVTRAAGPGINRDTDNGREIGHNSDSASSEGFCLPDISGSQEGWRPPSYSELEGPKQVHSREAFQDGRLSHGEGFGETWGLVGQNRSEGCLLSGANRSQPPEVPSVSVAGQSLSIPLPTVRPILCPLHFHEADEASGGLSERERNQTDYISGRSIGPVQLLRHPDQTSGVYQGLVSDVGSNHQQEEIPAGTITRACVPGSNNFNCINASVLTQRESDPDPTGGQTVTFKIGSVSTENSNLCGHDDSSNASYPGGSTVSLALASFHKQSGATSIFHRGSETELLPSTGQDDSGGHTGVEVVDAGNAESQWVSFVKGSTRFGDRIRCISPGLGSNLKRSRAEDRGSVVNQRTGNAYKLPRVTGSITGYSDICQGKEKCQHLGENRQCVSQSIYKPLWRNSLMANELPSCADMEVVYRAPDISDSRASSRSDELSSRRGIKDSARSLRLDASSSTVLADREENGSPRSGHVCIPPNTSASTLFVGDRTHQRKQQMPLLRIGVNFKGMRIPYGVSYCLLWQRFSGRRPKWSWWHLCGKHSHGIPSYFNC